MNDLLKDYKEMVPQLSDKELERQEESFARQAPNYTERDLAIYELILNELIRRTNVKLFSMN